MHRGLVIIPSVSHFFFNSFNSDLAPWFQTDSTVVKNFGIFYPFKFEPETVLSGGIFHITFLTL